LQLLGTQQRRQGARDAVHRARCSIPRAFGRLQRFPAFVAGFAGRWLAAEDVRMARLKLVRHGFGHIVEGEQPAFFGNARLEHHLEQQVAKLVPDVADIAARHGVGNFVGFLDGVRHDRFEPLRTIPFASTDRIAEAGHDAEEAVELL